MRSKGYTSYSDPGFSRFLRRSFSYHLGFEERDFGKPVIAICNTFSEVNRCHAHFNNGLIQAIKRGVVMEGGIPLEFPTISLGEPFLHPTSMLYRNLMAIDTEEMIRAQPLDAVVLVGGCDKTVPAQLMGAASANVPAILITGGPMLNGEYMGRTLGACTDCRHFWTEFRAGHIDEETLRGIGEQLAPSAGHCQVMGTASTMACLAEALGMMLPGAAAYPAPDNRRLRLAQETGRAAVRLALAGGPTPRQIITRAAFENAITVLHALSGSTNAVLHLLAIAGRCGVDLKLEDFDEIGRRTPVLANVRPAGEYQMQEFANAGGVPALMKELAPLLHLHVPTVSGKPLREILESVRPTRYRHVIRPLSDPLWEGGGLAILRGNLCPDGAVIKTRAASPHFLRHRGRAVVFRSTEDLEARINDPNLDVRPDDVLVLQNAGPKGHPGMPEAGWLPIPKKLLDQGVRDMVRISDARMSGTAKGTVVLHVAPEAAVGGPLAFVRDGDLIELDVPNRRLELLVPPAELERRRAEWRPPEYRDRGYLYLYRQHVLQADKGADFDFCRADFVAGA